MTAPLPRGPQDPTARLLGQSPAMQALRAQIRHLAAFDTLGNPQVPTLLLQGETGTGKGLTARVMHDSGPRAAGPFLEVNCAAIPDTLLEAELFGYEAGAFSEARRAKPGLWEAASGGTLFLDEIDALPVTLQGKLLTALEAKRVRRLGAVREQAVDVKLIAAAQTDLSAAVQAGRFRADLYHRLAVIVLTLPPLRARGEDIVVLARAYLERYATAHRVPPKQLSPGAEAWLCQHPWPGNVRELSHLLERVTLLRAEPIIEAATLAQLSVPPGESVAPTGTAPAAEVQPPPDEAARIRQALEAVGGNVVHAARLLGLSRGGLRYRMQRYGIAPVPRGTGPSSRLPRVAAAASPPTARQGSFPPTKAPGAVSVWEQKLVAVLAIDLVWPPAREPPDPTFEPWTTARRWEQAIGEKVQGFGGILLQRLASLFLVAFGVPRTLEQLPQRAVQAAVAIRQLVTEAHAEANTPVPTVRQAVHLGPMLIDTRAGARPERYPAEGETLSGAVRLLGHAGPGELLVSPEVGRLVAGWCARQARDVPAAAGEAPMRVYRVMGMAARHVPWAGMEGRPLSPFVGRARELAWLGDLLARAEEGRGQVVGIIGEPGVGKSRLMYEFLQALPPQSWLILASSPVAYGQDTPYLPVIDLLRAYFQVEPRDAEPAILAKVTEKLGRLDGAHGPLLPAVLTLLDVPVEDSHWQALEPPQRCQQTLEALKRLWLRASQEQPLLLVVENLHWIDTETQACLDHLVESLATARICLVVNYRPGYRHSWGSKTYYTQLRLDPLSAESAAELLQALLGDDASLQPVKRYLIHQTEGNPFFVEESIHALVETQVLVGGRGAYGLTKPMHRVQVPATIQAVLAARIDRLPAEEKRLLQMAAVIGTEVPFALLQVIAEAPEAWLHGALAHLQAAEFLYEWHLSPELAYTFKHALTQEVAYHAVPVEQRRVWHERVAQAIETRFRGRLEEWYSALAHHYSRSGNTAKAVDYLSQAGQQAVRRSAYTEAVSHLTAALDWLTTVPETPERQRQELVVQMTLGAALRATKGSATPEVEQHYLRARALCEQVGEPPQLFRVLWGLWGVYNIRGDAQTMRALGEQLLNLAQRLQDPDLLLEAHHALWTSLFSSGELLAARAHQEEGLRLYNPQRHRTHAGLYSSHDPGVCCRYRAAPALWLLGYPDQALASSHAAVALAQQLAHPLSLAQALYWAAVLHHLRREAPLTQARAEAVITVMADLEIPIEAVNVMPLRGWALTARGRREEERVQSQQALADDRPTQWDRDRPYHLALLAEASAQVGQPAAGLKVLDEALAMVAQSAAQWWEAELYRLRGELLLQCAGAHQGEAATCFQQALDVARRQQAKSLELRAAMSLSRLWQQQGKRDEARQLLAEVYGWLTEGFDTPDLQEAKALLEELSG